MDVLDNILPLMDKGGEKKKVKKEDVKDTSAQSSSFRIPKKPRNTTETAIGQQTSETNNSVSMQTRSEPVPSLSLRDNYRGECKSVSNSGAENKSRDSSINIKRFDTTKRFNFVVPRTIVVEMNGVALDLSNAVEAVDRYHVTITQVRGQKEKDATRGPKNDIAFQHRRRALFSIVRQIMKTHQEHFGSNRYAHIYDLGNTLYSIGCNISAADGEQTYHLNADEISSSFARSFFGGSRLTEMIVTFVHTGKVYLKGPSLYESDGSFREAQKFFEVLSSQIILEFQGFLFSDYLGYMNKFYEKSQENDKKLGDGKCVKNGFEKNVRILGDNVDNAIPVMQTDIYNYYY
uniref:Argonaute protein hrde-1/Nuclear RNAi defective-3 protein-like N-terminal domain-containing protein n=1 Tax=Heterorhabditis bacteriophora TaxID=37862 RepID=A0A1I7XT50_HETBA